MFPGIYSGTGEPILINGSLLNLGDVAINRHGPRDAAAKIEVAATKVVKLQVFRDEVSSCSWDSFIDSPIKHVVSLVPALQRCPHEGGCGAACPFYHPPVDSDLKQVINEIWSRRFQSLAGKATEDAKADVFQAFLRLTESAFGMVLSSIVAGIYFEPRGESRGPDPDYAMINLASWS